MTATTSDLVGLLNENLPQLSIDAVERKRWPLEFFPRAFQQPGDAYDWKVNNSGNTAVELFVEGQAEPDPGQQGYLKPTLPWANIRAKVKVEKMAIDDNRGSVAILRDILVREMDGGQMDLVELLTDTIYGTNASLGMLLAVDSAGTYAGVDRSVNTEWQSVEAAGAGSQTVLQTALDAVQEPSRKGKRATHIVCNHTEARVIDGFSNSNQSLRITQDEAMNVAPGGDGITNIGGFTGTIHDSAHVAVAPGFAANTVLTIHQEDWLLVTHRDFTVEPFKRELDALETVISWRGALACHRPFRQAKNTGF